MKVQLSRIDWSRVIWTSILVTILVTFILNPMVVFLFLGIGGGQEQILFQVNLWSPSILSILLTGVCAIWAARTVGREAALHGFLVGLITALILFLFSSNITNFFQGAYRGRLELLVVALGTFVLTIAAGWLGGILGSRVR